MKRKTNRPKIDTGRWLTTYSDMMNNLLVLFMVLYAMSVLDLEKFQALATQFSDQLSNNTEIEGTVIPSGSSSENAEITIPSGSEDTTPTPTDSDEAAEKFDTLYEKLKAGIDENGYADLIELEKQDAYIKFKFRDSVLFYPDSANMRPDGLQVLKYVGNLLCEVAQYTNNIEIGGHTAQTGTEAQATIFAWQLSANRAISVLQYLVKSGLAQSKMSIAGYSHYDPVGDNSTEAGRQANRRVEIKVIRITSDTAVNSGG